MTQPTDSKAVQHDTPDVSSLSVNVSDKEKTPSPAALPAAESGDRTGRRGAQRNNTLRLAHGLRANRWPKGCRRAANRVNRFYNTLVAAVVERDGELGIEAASAIDVAVRWQKHCELAQRWLALEFERLEPMERLHFSREAAKGAAERDKAVRLLNLARSAEAEIDALYAELRSGALDAEPTEETAQRPQNGGHE